MFTTLSTILVPITTGFTSSVSLNFALLLTELELLLLALGFEVLCLEGEQDCCLTLPLPLELESVEVVRMLGPLGLPLDAETDLAGKDVLKFGGVSREKPGISEGFHGRDLTVGELPRDDSEFLSAVGSDFATVEERF